MLDDDREHFRVDARRRLLLFGGFNAVMLSLIGTRLFYLQVLKGGEYRDLADDNRISMRPIPAPRGRIFDCHGNVLVDNRPNFQLMVIPEIAKEMRPLLARLHPLLELTDKEIETILRQTRRQRAFLPLMIKSHLTWEEVSRVEARIHTFPGTTLQAQSMRHYPYGNSSAHVLGYLAEVSESDKKLHPDVRPGVLVGKGGIELIHEKHLRGTEGVRELEVNAYGREVRSLRATPPQAGNDLTLTIDIDLQQEAENALGDRSGAVVAIDPRNGEVLVAVSMPSFDPNQFIRGIEGKQWQAWMKDPMKPLLNKFLRGQYPPGSTFKMITALAALAKGKVTPTTSFFCPGFREVYGHRYHCWKKGGHGSVAMVQGIAQSCDTYFYHLAERLDIDDINEMAHAMGLGELTGIDLDHEKPGLIPSKAWKKSTLRQPWYPGESLVNAIGQGYVLVTPLQMARMAAAFANGGILHRPKLSRLGEFPEAEIIGEAHVNPQHLAVVREGMFQVLHGERGTAKMQKLAGGILAAGKTGTAQVISQRREVGGKVINSKDRRYKDHALFICYAPFDAPEIAISVVVEHGGHGGSDAAPVAKRVLDLYFARKGMTGSGSMTTTGRAQSLSPTGQPAPVESTPPARGMPMIEENDFLPPSEEAD